jgi:hypothetical protein
VQSKESLSKTRSFAALGISEKLTPPGAPVESQGPLAILWVGIGLCCFYIALVWLNTLLGFFLTPLFIIPATWLMDWKKRRDQEKNAGNR